MRKGTKSARKVKSSADYAWRQVQTKENKTPSEIAQERLEGLFHKHGNVYVSAEEDMS